MQGDQSPRAHFSVAIALDGLSPGDLNHLYRRIVSHLHHAEGVDVFAIAADAESETGLIIVRAENRQSVVDGAEAAGLPIAEVREIGYISPTTVIEAFGVGQQSFDPFWKHARDG